MASTTRTNLALQMPEADLQEAARRIRLSRSPATRPTPRQVKPAGRRGYGRIGPDGRSNPGQPRVETLGGADRLRPPGFWLAVMLGCGHLQSSFCLGGRAG